MLAYTNLVIFAKYFFQFPLFCTYRSASGTVFDAGLSCLSNPSVEVRVYTVGIFLLLFFSCDRVYAKIFTSL